MKATPRQPCRLGRPLDPQLLPTYASHTQLHKSYSMKLIGMITVLEIVLYFIESRSHLPNITEVEIQDIFFAPASCFSGRFLLPATIPKYEEH